MKENPRIEEGKHCFVVHDAVKPRKKDNPRYYCKVCGHSHNQNSWIGNYHGEFGA